MHSHTRGTTEIKSMETEGKMDAWTERYAGAKSAGRLPGKPG